MAAHIIGATGTMLALGYRLAAAAKSPMLRTIAASAAFGFVRCGCHTSHASAPQSSSVASRANSGPIIATRAHAKLGR